MWNYYKMLQTWKRKRIRRPNFCLFIFSYSWSSLPLYSKIIILRGLIFLTIYSYILLMPIIQHFFVKDNDSVIEIMNVFDKFLLLSGLKPNKAKYEIADIGVLKGVSVALFSMDCIYLTKKTEIFRSIFFL